MMKPASILIRYGSSAVGLILSFAGVVSAASRTPSGLNFGNSPQTVTLTNRGGPVYGAESGPNALGEHLHEQAGLHRIRPKTLPPARFSARNADTTET